MSRLVDIWNGRGELAESVEDRWKTTEPEYYEGDRRPAPVFVPPAPEGPPHRWEYEGQQGTFICATCAADMRDAPRPCQVAR